jgi:hypothetical protein
MTPFLIRSWAATKGDVLFEPGFPIAVENGFAIESKGVTLCSANLVKPAESLINLKTTRKSR